MARTKEFERDEALRKALFTFWSKGYEGTSISDLTDTMGLSRSSLYETFGDKQELFLEALKSYLSFTAKRRIEILAEADSVKQGMANFFQSVIAFVLDKDNPGGCFLTNTLTALGTLDEHITIIIKHSLENQEDDFFAFLEEGQRKGEISSEKDIRALARFYVGLVRGISALSKVQKDKKVLEDIVMVALKELQ